MSSPVPLPLAGEQPARPEACAQGLSQSEGCGLSSPPSRDVACKQGVPPTTVALPSLPSLTTGAKREPVLEPPSPPCPAGLGSGRRLEQGTEGSAEEGAVACQEAAKKVTKDKAKIPTSVQGQDEKAEPPKQAGSAHVPAKPTKVAAAPSPRAASSPRPQRGMGKAPRSQRRRGVEWADVPLQETGAPLHGDVGQLRAPAVVTKKGPTSADLPRPPEDDLRTVSETEAAIDQIWEAVACAKDCLTKLGGHQASDAQEETRNTLRTLIEIAGNLIKKQPPPPAAELAVCNKHLSKMMGIVEGLLGMHDPG